MKNFALLFLFGLLTAQFTHAQSCNFEIMHHGECDYMGELQYLDNTGNLQVQSIHIAVNGPQNLYTVNGCQQILRLIVYDNVGTNDAFVGSANPQDDVGCTVGNGTDDIQWLSSSQAVITP